MTSPEQLERETEQTRSQIADTLEELRARLRPGQLVSELADRVGDAGARAFLSNLKRQTIANPVPVALIGAGFAWLMLGGDKAGSKIAESIGDAGRGLVDDANAAVEPGDTAEQSSAANEGSAWSDKAANLAEDARDRVSSAADNVKRSASNAGNTMRDMAGSIGDSLQRSASTGYQAFSDGARTTASRVADSARAAGPRTLQASNAFIDFCREQPLVLAGFGLAIGAAMGALLPQTDPENRLMGESSDRLKENAENLASQQYDTAKAAAEHALAAAQDVVAKPAGETEQGSDERKYERKPGASVADQATLVPAEHAEDQPQADDPSPDHAHP